MKKQLCFKTALLVSLCATASVTIASPLSSWMYGQPLNSSESVINALDGGAVVNAAVDLSLCTRQDGGPPSETKGGLQVSPYRVQGDGTLSFSDSHFTVSTRSGSPKPITQFLRYKVSPEGSITVSSFIYSVPEYNLISQVAFDCAIDNGVSFHAVY